jgi:hypothetical protein
VTNHPVCSAEAGPPHDLLRGTLERLLEIDATALEPARTQAAQRIAEALHTEKVDAFLYQPAIDTLVALGVSDTPMGERQQALGLNRLPVSNGGRTVQVFQTGTSFRAVHSPPGAGASFRMAVPIPRTQRRRQAAPRAPEGNNGRA